MTGYNRYYNVGDSLAV